MPKLLPDTAACVEETVGRGYAETGKHVLVEWQAGEVAAQESHLADAGVGEDLKGFISLGNCKGFQLEGER